MAIHPIDYRYGSKEMRQIFTEENKIQKMLEVEAALAKAHAAVGNIPKEAAEEISRKATTKFIKVQRVKEIEEETKHDLMALVKALTEASGKSGAWVHLGATSNDIIDTSLALQIKDALEIFRKDLIDILKLIAHLANSHKDTLCVGRTHGIHATVYVFGHKFAVWADEIMRHIERLEQCRDRVCVGKMSGVVGTQAGFGSHAKEIQNLAMQYLGLRAAPITTQIVPRDRLSELICLLALISSSLDKFATEIRNLQRTEIREVEEPFKEETQVGSTALPHKRNPINSEKISGLAKILRGTVIPALENVVSWHERDLSNSSCERAIIPEAFILLDEQLKTFKKVLEGLHIYPENIARNLHLTKGLIMTESIVLALVNKGLGRQEAHEIVRKCAMEVWNTQKTLAEVLKSNPAVTRYLKSEEIEEALDPAKYIGTAKQQIQEVVERTKTIEF
ncbi:MAG: adenylosuccinate lyase [Euryarchaeota archaeon]|nr:adenylosuccinate lyase [Euryarchaeota archaeon]